MTRVPRAWLQTTWPAYRWVTRHQSLRPLASSVRIRIAWQSFWASTNWRIANHLLEQSNRDGAGLELRHPVFVIGLWRSGTTIMHELLVAATGLSAPQTWQCMNASSFLLTRSPADVQTAPRPMDQLTVRSDSPQEDEFALLTLGICSAYLAFLRPDRIGELQVTLDQEFWLHDARWHDVWVRFLRAVLRTLPRPQQPLILKSPNHTFRLRSILAHFPGAKLIWMMRDPIDTFHSNIRMWQSMFSLYGLTSADHESLDNFLATALSNAAEALSWCCASLPPSQLAIVSADHLVNEPEATVRAICERLELTRQFEAGNGVQPNAVQLHSEAHDRRGLSAGAMRAVARLGETYARVRGAFEARP